MKKIFLFSIAICLFASMFGQITITQGDLPSNGTIIVIYKDTVVTPPAYDYFVTGTNFIWNPGSVTQHDTLGYIVSDPASSPAFIHFPTSNLMLNIPGYGAYFMKSTANELLTLGMVDSVTLPSPVVISMNPADTIMIFPLKYDTTYSSHSAFDGKYYYGQTVQGFFADSIRIKNVSVSNSHVDGWGTLVHPDGNLDVLRESKNIYSLDSLWVRLQSFSMWVLAYASDSAKIEVNFHANGFGLPVFTVRADGDSIVKEIEWIYNPSTTIRFNDDSPLFSVFPNPARDYVTIETLRGEADRIDIYDLTGKLICSVPSQKNIELNISSWDSGAYMIQWITKNKVIANSKFIKL
jgi:hypothetical protein